MKSKKVAAIIMILGMIIQPTAAFAKGFVDWDNAIALSNSFTSYTATADGFVMAAGINNAGWHATVTSANGITKTYVARSDNSDDYDDVIIPLASGDKVTFTQSGGSYGWNNAYFVPASGGVSVEDLKEELKKGTFEEIKTKIIHTTGDATVDGKLVVKGETDLQGNVSVDKNLTVDGNEEVKGNSTVGGNLDVNGDISGTNITASETTSTKDLNVSNNASIGGDLSVDGTSNLKDTNVDGNLTVSGNTTTAGKTTTDSLDVTNDATVGGNTTLNTLAVNGTSVFNENVTMKKDLSVAGTSNLKDTNVDGNLTVSGDTTTAGKTTTDSLNVTHDATVGGNTTLNTLTVNSHATFKAGADMGGQKVTNVAPGNVSATSTDAINGSQLYAVQQDTSDKFAQMANRVQAGLQEAERHTNKTGANAAALAGLRPLDWNPEDKWNISTGIGNYKGETAYAVGAFYRPSENSMLNVATSFGTGEIMLSGGVSFRIGKGKNLGTHSVQTKAIVQEETEKQTAVIASTVKDFERQKTALKKANGLLLSELAKMKAENSNLSAKFAELQQDVKSFKTATNNKTVELKNSYEKKLKSLEKQRRLAIKKAETLAKAEKHEATPPLTEDTAGTKKIAAARGVSQKIKKTKPVASPVMTASDEKDVAVAPVVMPTKKKKAVSSSAVAIANKDNGQKKNKRQRLLEIAKQEFKEKEAIRAAKESLLRKEEQKAKEAENEEKDAEIIGFLDNGAKAIPETVVIGQKRKQAFVRNVGRKIAAARDVRDVCEQLEVLEQLEQ